MSRLMTKPTKWHVRPATTQISLGIRPVWSEALLSTWRTLRSLATHWVFAGRTVILYVHMIGSTKVKDKSLFWTSGPTTLQEGEKSGSRPETAIDIQSSVLDYNVIRVLNFPSLRINTPNNFVSGKISRHYAEWSNITSDNWVLNIVESGYDTEFEKLPPESLTKRQIVFKSHEENIM